MGSEMCIRDRIHSVTHKYTNLVIYSFRVYGTQGCGTLTPDAPLPTLCGTLNRNIISSGMVLSSTYDGAEGVCGGTNPNTKAIDDDYALAAPTYWQPIVVGNTGTSATFDINFNANYTVTGVEIIWSPAVIPSQVVFLTSSDGITWANKTQDLASATKFAMIDYYVAGHTARYGRVQLNYSSAVAPSLRDVQIFGCDQGASACACSRVAVLLFMFTCASGACVLRCGCRRAGAVELWSTPTARPECEL